MYADTADYGEWKNCCRSTGLIFSASTMSQKVGWAIGGSTAAWLLYVMGFQPNVAQSGDVRHSLVLLMSLIPACLGLVSIAIVAFYPLNETRVGQIEAELKARRAAAEPAA
jgi:GPH family glycoside/pentoside/hexuronide:cation symporter